MSPPSPPWPCDLRRLSDGSTHRLTRTAGAYLAEAAAVCLETAGHQPGRMMRIAGTIEAESCLTWEPATDEVRRTHADIQEATEEGACALAIMLAFFGSEYQVIHRSWKKTGFDYGLGYADDPNYIKARLEVSGILNGDDRTIDRRVNQKLRQTDQSDETGLPAFVAVVEFGQPFSVFVKK